MTDSVGVSKTAATAVAIHPLLADRWSPRGFDSEREVTRDQVLALLEAARWSPSGGNTQPWRILVTRRGTAAHAQLCEQLTGGNRAWAGDAPVLLVMLAVMTLTDGEVHPSAEYDTGQAAAHLSIQAEAMGMSVHQMGGFDKAGVLAEFELPENLLPKTVIAVGYLDSRAELAEPFATRERNPRARAALSDIVLLNES